VVRAEKEYKIATKIKNYILNGINEIYTTLKICSNEF